MSNLSAQDYAFWKHHPVTQVMFNYFYDYADRLTNIIAESVLADVPVEGDARGRVLQLRELPDLPWNEVRDFYGLPPEEESNG